jgi:hypothetical protein
MFMSLPELDKKAKEYYYSDQLDKALFCYAQAFIQYPNMGLAYSNYGNLLRESGYPERAYKFIEMAIEINPDERIPPFNLAVAHLAAGDLEKGWELFEARWRFKHHEHILLQYEKPRWEGQDVTGKTVAVLCEEGDGDNIQFIRFIKHVEELGATVIIQTEPQLKELFTNSFNNLVIDNTEELPEHDYWIPILSLPKLLKITYENFPVSEQYITPNKQPKWKKILGRKTKKRIGFCWRGRTKKIPFNVIVDFIKAHPQYEWISLQAALDDGEEEVLSQLNVKDYFDNITNWNDTAGLIEHLDYVISIDTGLIHLAGAMNKTGFLLLDRYRTCWRWLYDRNDTPWYSSLTLVRQKQIQGFVDQFEELSKLLAG